MTDMFAAPCSYCADRNRPSPPVPPLWTELTDGGVLATYRCPVGVCRAEWVATWAPGDDAAMRPYPGEHAA